MKLIAFKAEHFRCLYQTDWIPFSELSIFTGENDGGKSTTLYALDVFLSPRKMPNMDDFSYATITPENPSGYLRETEIILQGKFELNPSEIALLAVWGITNPVIEIKRTIKADLLPSPYMLFAETYDDDAFKQPLDDYTIPQLKDIATRFSINIGAARLKQEIVDMIRAWVIAQPKVIAEVKLPDSLITCLPEIQIFSSESALA